MTDRLAPDHQRLLQQLGFVAGVLDRYHLPGAGNVRQAVRLINDLLTNGAHPASAGCRGCGDPVPQPPTGRRRVWCSEPCRRRHRP